MNDSDFEIMRALVEQVRRAADGGDERNVVTIVTRPMWEAFDRSATGEGDTIYGSKTVVVESDKFQAISRAL